MKEKQLFNIPNILTLYRIAVFPLILGFILSGKENLFAIFVIINLLTDVADGFIARKFKLETEFGAKIDSFADDLTYLAAIIGIFVFKWEDFMPYMTSFLIFVGFLIIPIIVYLIRLGKIPSFHLYMTKIGGYIQGLFFFCLFTIGFVPSLYYFMIVWGILGSLEHLAIQFYLKKEIRSNVKGLYWVLKEKKIEKQI
ncbi:MAG TPA: CDP-alcohol phosphatidyltransferase family protein [Bacteroidales bacterium]|nr:CDP-alcohol phosphatidyltransferase family protein [Bacteroidales bacterium]